MKNHAPTDLKLQSLLAIFGEYAFPCGSDDQVLTLGNGRSYMLEVN